MLWAWGNVEALIGEGVVGISIPPCIVRIVIIYDRVNHIDIYATESIYHFGKAAQTDPGIAVDGDTIVLLNRLACCTHAIIEAVVLCGSQKKCLIDFVHALRRWHPDPGVAGNRDQVNGTPHSINMDHHHYLCKHSQEYIYPDVVST